MALREIVKLGDDILRKKCRPVTAFDEKLWQLLDDMKETLVQAQGAGLAAPQVGMLRRVCIIDVHDNRGVIELINPEIIESSGLQCGGEGCLSLPNEWHEVERPMNVTVKAQDRNGEFFTMSGDGLFARAVCHETDHLDGVLFIDKAKPDAE